MPRRKTTTKSTAVESSELAVNKNNESQLSLFDYSGYSEDFKLKSYERKARIKANEQVATKAFYDIAQDVKAQHDDLGDYQKWLEWCNKELDYKENMACSFLKIGTEITAEFRSKTLPTSHSALDRLARALSKADEETKEEILTAVEEKTEEKGKALTEKEIKEITSPYLEQIEQLKKEKEQLALDLESHETRVENVKGYYQSQLDSQEKKLTEAKETLANQNKQIQQLNSDISAKENQLKAISDKEDELDQELTALQESKANFDDIVDQTVQDKLAEEKAKALAEIEKQKEVLKTQENQLKTELKKQKAILDELDKQKKAFVKGSEWLQKIENFNNLFTERALGINVISTLEDLTSLPDFNNLADEEKEIFARQFNSNLQIFLKNKEAWANAVNQIELILNQMRLELNISDSKAVDVEVLNA